MTNPAGQDKFRQGLALFNAGKYQEAFDIFQEITENDETNHKVWNALGVTSSKIGEQDSALICFKNALSFDPDNAKYKSNLEKLLSKKKYTRKKTREKTHLPVHKKKKQGSGKTGFLLYVVILVVLLVIMGVAVLIYNSGTLTNQADLPVLTGVQPRQPVTTSTPAVLTPSATLITPSSTTPITPSQTYLTPAATSVPTPLPTIPGSIPMKVKFLDVGQGDSIFIQAGGKNMLIDAGPESAGPYVVSSLKSSGVSFLDVVVATHTGNDHIGGMNDVLNAFPVGIYLDSGASYTGIAGLNVMNTLKADQIRYTTIKPGEKIPFTSGVDVLAMAPANLTGEKNNDALVLKIIDGTHSFLLMGDATDARGEIRARILAVSRQGSSPGTSEEFLSRVKPEIAVIEGEINNDAGYQDQETLTNLTKSEVKVYRTDTDGTVTISIQGPAYQVTTTKITTLAISNR